MADRLGWVRSTGPAGLPPMVQRTPLQPRSPETKSYRALILLGRPAWAYRVELGRSRAARAGVVAAGPGAARRARGRRAGGGGRRLAGHPPAAAAGAADVAAGVAGSAVGHRGPARP